MVPLPDFAKDFNSIYPSFQTQISPNYFKKTQQIQANSRLAGAAGARKTDCLTCADNCFAGCYPALV
jgi:hypothetical protein